jgi:acyl carrier protein
VKDNEYVRTVLEPQVTEMVTTVLRRTDFGPADDLFDFGMTSLGFVRVISELNVRYGTSLNGSELGDTATVRSIASAVAVATENASPITA